MRKREWLHNVPATNTLCLQKYVTIEPPSVSSSSQCEQRHRPQQRFAAFQNTQAAAKRPVPGLALRSHSTQGIIWESCTLPSRRKVDVQNTHHVSSSMN